MTKILSQDFLKLVQKKYEFNKLQSEKNPDSEYYKKYITGKCYFDFLHDEIQEAKEELQQNNSVYLEDELSDILWNYCSMLQCLEEEWYITQENVIERCFKKYSQRTNGIESWVPWEDIKLKQKQELKKEHEEKYTNSLVDPFQDQTTEIYDVWAKIYQERTQDLEDFWWMLAAFQGFVKSWKTLDIGCAYGRHMLAMLESWYDAYGIELSSELISLAQPQVREKITHGSMLDIEKIYPKESFDGIISSASIVHMDKEFWMKVLQDIFSLLKHEWYLYLSFLVKDTNMSSDTKIKPSKTIPTNKKYVYYSESEMDSILTSIWFTNKKVFLNSPNNDTWKTIITQKI